VHHNPIVHCHVVNKVNSTTPLPLAML